MNADAAFRGARMEGRIVERAATALLDAGVPRRLTVASSRNSHLESTRESVYTALAPMVRQRGESPFPRGRSTTASDRLPWPGIGCPATRLCPSLAQDTPWHAWPEDQANTRVDHPLATGVSRPFPFALEYHDRQQQVIGYSGSIRGGRWSMRSRRTQAGQASMSG